jgi:hypothetical protein
MGAPSLKPFYFDSIAMKKAMATKALCFGFAVVKKATATKLPLRFVLVLLQLCCRCLLVFCFVATKKVMTTELPSPFFYILCGKEGNFKVTVTLCFGFVATKKKATTTLLPLPSFFFFCCSEEGDYNELSSSSVFLL